MDADAELSLIVNRTARDVLPEIPTGVITLTVLDPPQFDMFMNFHRSAEFSGVYNILVVTFSNESDLLLTNHSIPHYYEQNFTEEITEVNQISMTTIEPRKLDIIKFILVLRILKLGYGVFYCDIDSVFLNYPFTEFTCFDCDFEVGPDNSQNPTDMNIGIILFRPTIWTVRFLEHLIYHLYTHPEVDARKGFQQLANRYTYLRFRVLPFESFPTAYHQQYYYHEKGVMPLKITNQMMRLSLCNTECERLRMFNVGRWVKGYRKKRYRLRELLLWKYDGDKYYSGKRKYLIYGNPVPPLYQREKHYLKIAFQLCKVFNRTLILPEFHCPQSARKLCTLSEILDLEDFELLGHQYREHSFLENPRVPWDPVLSSISRPSFIRSTDMDSYIHLFHLPTDSDVYQPFKYPGPVTEEELRRWFDPLQHYSVLKFHSVYFNVSLYSTT